MMSKKNSILYGTLYLCCSTFGNAKTSSSSDRNLRGSAPEEKTQLIPSQNVRFLNGAEDFCHGDTLDANRALERKEYLCAGEYRFGMDGTGRLNLQHVSVSDGKDWLNHEWNTVWQADQNGISGDSLKMQGDGNLVMRNEEGSPLWSSSTHGNPGAKMVLFNSGDSRIAAPNDASNVLWRVDTDPDWLCVGDSLGPNKKLLNGQYICKDDQTVGLVDGRLLVERYNGVVWTKSYPESTLVTGGLGSEMVMQNDGNLVIKSSNGEPLWSSRTNGNPNLVLGFFGYLESPSFESTDGSVHVSLRDEERECIGNEFNSYENGGRMDSGEMLCNMNRYYFGLDRTGDLAFWDKHMRDEKMWSAGTGGSYGNYLKFDDGDLVVYTFNGTRLWSTETYGNGEVKLHIDSDGNVELITENTYHVIWSLKDYSVFPGALCAGDTILPGQRFDRNQMICDSFGSGSWFGLDGDGRLTRASHVVSVNPSFWNGHYYDMGGRFGHHAYFQGDGNFVVYSKNDEALWSTRTNVGYPKDQLQYNCYSHGDCRIEFHENNGGKKEWHSQDFYCRDRAIYPDERLDPTEFICSDKNGHRFGLDKMGDLGLYLRGRKRLSAETLGSYGNHLVMQKDGNLVLYNYEKKPLWSSKTENNPGAYATIDDTGIVSVKTNAGATIWSMTV